MMVTHFGLVDVVEKQLYIIPRVMMASDDAALARLFFMIIPNTNAILIIRKRTNYLFLRELPAFQGRTITISRGHRCRPFSPPVRAFNFYGTKGSAFSLLVDFHRMLLTHALALSANQLQEKGLYEYVHSVRIELSK